MQTAKLCKMIFLPPYVVHGTHSIKQEEITQHKNNINELLSIIRHEKIDVEKASRYNNLNEYLETN
jgi:glutathione-regulated potassium-efflux system ancillary protein KefG